MWWREDPRKMLHKKRLHWVQDGALVSSRLTSSDVYMEVWHSWETRPERNHQLF